MNIYSETDALGQLKLDKYNLEQEIRNLVLHFIAKNDHLIDFASVKVETSKQETKCGHIYGCKVDVNVLI